MWHQLLSEKWLFFPYFKSSTYSWIFGGKNPGKYKDENKIIPPARDTHLESFFVLLNFDPNFTKGDTGNYGINIMK